MATKKPSKSKAKAASGAASVSVLPHAVLITLDAKQQAAMKKCLAKSGKITMRFDELSVTELPSVGSRMVVPITD